MKKELSERTFELSCGYSIQQKNLGKRRSKVPQRWNWAVRAQRKYQTESKQTHRTDRENRVNAKQSIFKETFGRAGDEI